MPLRTDLHVLRFQQAATRFCQEVESAQGNDAWGLRLTSHLAEVYAAAYRLPDVPIDDDTPDIPDEFNVSHEAWQARYDGLRTVQGENDGYWGYYDPSDPSNADEKPIYKSLADDLADIHRDLSPGLRAWNSGRDELLPAIVWGWKHPLFGSHWGVHAVSALGLLHHLVHDRGFGRGSANADPSAKS